MRRLAKYLFPIAVVTGVWGASAPAHGQPAPDPATSVDTPAPEGLSDADLLKLSQGEAIEIYDERPDKPFDRDTEVRLTGEELAARGAVDLEHARSRSCPTSPCATPGAAASRSTSAARARARSAILIDGVLVSDPCYGTFDVSTIPITDIVQIRVATTPQSPIDGPGGPGGVIEVHTRDAIGPQLVVARADRPTRCRRSA